MSELTDVQNQMGNIEGQFAQYQNPDLTTQVRQQVLNAYTPLLQNSSNETNRMLSEFLPRFMESPYQGVGSGTTAASLTPQQQMTQMGRNLGTMVGQLSSNAQLANSLGGNLNTMYGNAGNALQFGYGTLQDRYSRLSHQYDQLFAAQEAAKSRAASSPSFNYPAPQQATTQQQLLPGEDTLLSAAGYVQTAQGWVKGGSPNEAQLYTLLNQWQMPEDVKAPYWAAWRTIKYGPGTQGMTQDQVNQGVQSGNIGWG